MNKELIILCAPPGAGKSTLAKTQFPTMPKGSYINQDSQGKEGHKKLFEESLKLEDLLIVIDRMNFNKEQRSRYLIPAKKAGYVTKIIVLHESYDTCLKRCIERQGHETIKNEETARKALHTFFSKYERPTEDEADEIEFRYPEILKPNALICDLDGTLCNVDHRLHFVKKQAITKDVNIEEKTVTMEYTKPDWKNFFYNMAYDTPNRWCKDIVHLLAQRYDIILCSGRPDDYREVTKTWLKEHSISYDNLFMRSRNDFRKDDVIKEILLDFEIKTRYNPVFAIDDRKQVVDMWRKRGIVTLACAEGDF